MIVFIFLPLFPLSLSLLSLSLPSLSAICRSLSSPGRRQSPSDPLSLLSRVLSLSLRRKVSIWTRDLTGVNAISIRHRRQFFLYDQRHWFERVINDNHSPSSFRLRAVSQLSPTSIQLRPNSLYDQPQRTTATHIN